MKHSLFLRYVAAVAAICLALFIHYTFHPLLQQSELIYLVLFAAVMIVQVYSGLGPALLALGLGGGLAAWLGSGGHWTSSNLTEIAVMGFYLSLGSSVLLGQSAHRRHADTLVQERQRVDALQLEQAHLLELVAKGYAGDECLGSTADAVTRLLPDAVAAVILPPLQGQQPRVYAANAVDEFVNAIRSYSSGDQAAMTPYELSMFSAMPVNSELIKADDRYPAAWRQACAEQGVNSCHCEPIIGTQRTVLGCFLICLPQAGPPGDWAQRIARFGAQISSITVERDRAVNAISESQRRFREIIDGLPAAIFTTDAEGRLTDFNPAAAVFAGRQPELGKDRWCVSWKLYTPSGEPLNHEECPLAQAVHSGRAIQGAEAIAQLPNGARRWLMAYPTPLRDNQGGVIGGVNMLVDVTAYKRTEIALRESEARFRAAFHQSAFGMAQSDLKGRHVLANERYCELTGYTQEELVHRTFLDITHPDDAEKNAELFKQLISEEAPRYEMEKRYIRKDGSIVWAQVGVSLVRDENGTPLYAISGVQNIEERKRKEQSLRFLVDLSTAVQQLVEPEAIMRITARMLGEHLDADRCAYAEVEDDEDHFVITGDHNRGVNSIVGRFSMASFGAEVLRLMRAGQPYVVHDVDNDPQVTEADLPAYRATQIQSVVCVPLLKAGRFVAAMAVHQQVPRVWSKEDVEFIQLVVARCWESIERARSVRNLQNSEQRMRFVLDSMPQKVFTATPEGTINYLNPQWTSFAGLSFDEFRKKGESSLVHPDDLERNRDAWRTALLTGRDVEIEHRFRNLGGEYRWHMTRALAMRDAQGKIIMWIGSNTDIHDLKLAEEAAIHRSEQVHRLAHIATRLNTAATIAAVLDTVNLEARSLIPSHLAITWVVLNEQWSQATSSVSLSGKYLAWSNYWKQVDDPGVAALVYRSKLPLRMTPHDWQAHPLTQLDANPQQPVLRGWLGVPLIGLDGSSIGVMQLSDKYEGDFTQDDEAVLVQLAQMTSVALENARLVEGLREADRRKDEFLAILAHELRNPLAPIRNTLEIMKMTSSDIHTIEQTQMMERQLVHMVRLIDDLLDVSRVSRGKLDLRFEVVDVLAIIGEILEGAALQTSTAGHKLLVDLPKESVYVRADPTRLKQMIGNLIDNACKYTDSGGVIEVSAAQHNDRLLIRVKDNGIGIPEHKLDEIFELFSQVDRSLERVRAGLGIGLTLVKQLVELHGGAISAFSRGIGQGSEFTLSLPISEALLPARPDPAIHAATDRLTRKILIVDDNEDAASSLSMLLECSGDLTAIAYDGMAGLEQAAVFQPDIILLDIGLPKLNGYDVCRRLRAEPGGDELIIFAISGWGQDKDREQSASAGFDQHFVKPLDFAALRQALDSAWEASTCELAKLDT